MRTALSLLLVPAALLLGAACGDDDGRGSTDAGTGGGMDGAASTDAGHPDGACIPMIEICGDRIDQNCDGRETPCGDTDGDGIDACRPGDDLTMCDCDDERTDVRPAFGTSTPGAPELCDGVDNDCNGRVDEAAACCAGCADLSDRTRADVCLEDGTCACSTEPGMAVCAEGETCCASGCTNIQTDYDNCGFCGAQCTASADNCSAGVCQCGSGPVCDLVFACTDGSCAM